MIFFIDGYNVLHCCFHESHDTAKPKLIQAMDRFSKKNNHQCIIVFDGGGGFFVSKYAFSERTEIVYTGYDMSADNYIIQGLQRVQGDCALVSFDKEITSAAFEAQCIVIDPTAFVKIIFDRESQELGKKYQSTIKKYNQTDDFDPDLDASMEYYTRSKQIAKKKNEQMKISFSSPSKTPSKRERHLESVLKKIVRKK